MPDAAKPVSLTFRRQLAIVAQGAKRGFTYDGCTAVPDFDFGADCCGEHDFHYQAQVISRAEADKRLHQCILAKGYPLIAWAYWLGVRAVGWVFWNRRKKENAK